MLPGKVQERLSSMAMLAPMPLSPCDICAPDLGIVCTVHEFYSIMTCMRISIMEHHCKRRTLESTTVHN